MKTQFPNVVAAVEVREQRLSKTAGSDLWAIGDALMKDISRTAPCGDGNDGSREEIEKCSKELEKLGYKSYTISWLARILATAEAFPKSKRKENVPFSAHQVSGNPEILDWIEKSAGNNKVTDDLAKDMVSLWKERLKTKQPKGEKLPAKKDMPAPSKDDIPVVAKELSLLRFGREAKKLAAEASRLAREAIDEIDGVMLDVNPSFIAVATETALEAAKSLENAATAWRDVSNTVRKTTQDKRRHLAVVGE